jgi:hypothetical protein
MSVLEATNVLANTGLYVGSKTFTQGAQSVELAKNFLKFGDTGVTQLFNTISVGGINTANTLATVFDIAGPITWNGSTATSEGKVLRANEDGRIVLADSPSASVYSFTLNTTNYFKDGQDGSSGTVNVQTFLPSFDFTDAGFTVIFQADLSIDGNVVVVNNTGSTKTGQVNYLNWRASAPINKLTFLIHRR